MKKLSLFIAIVALVACSSRNEIIPLDEMLGLPGVTELTEIEADTLVFKSAYEIKFSQPVDHKQPGGDNFTQRLYFSYIGPDRPTILVTEGYSANRNYTTELARYLNCNQIIAEHRFFGESVPDSLDWTKLNTFQAASDHHRIIEFFSKHLAGKWITTGISKGGQTVMFHSFYYPDDADIRVPYVAPLNFGPEDERIYTFLDTVRTEGCRARVLEAQKNILEKRDVFYPMMLERTEDAGLTFERIGGPEVAFEMAVLEYDFAFWQWGGIDCEEILIDADDNDVFNQFFGISDVSYFADSGIKGLEPFFYQALTEIGYYGYRFDIFEGLLDYASDSDQPEFTFSAPQHVDLEYNYDLMKDVDNYIREADNFIYIYGMQDTWSATSVHPGKNTNSLKILKKGGDHRTRILNLPDDQRKQVISKLEEWLQ